MTLRRTPAGGIAAPWSVRLGNAAVACVNYIVQLFYPVDLAVFYPLPQVGSARLASGRRRSRFWSPSARRRWSGGAAVLICLSAGSGIWACWSPVLGLVQVRSSSRWPIVTCICPRSGWPSRWPGASRHCPPRALGRRWIVPAVAALAIAAWTACSIRQTTFSRGDEALWTHALASTAANGKAELGLAQALQLRGASGQAMDHYRRAIELGTDFNSFNGMGMLLVQQGKTSEAIEHFRKALQLQPDVAAVHSNLGWALVAANQQEEAEDEFRRALKLDPRSVNAHCGLAAVLRRQGNISQSRAQFEEALEIDPRKALAHVDLASLLLEQGETELAIEHLERALAIDPRLATGHVNLARALAARGQPGPAAEHYRQAIQLNPKDPVPRQELDKLER